MASNTLLMPHAPIFRDRIYLFTDEQKTSFTEAVKILDDRLVQGMDDKKAGRWTEATKRALDLTVRIHLVRELLKKDILRVMFLFPLGQSPRPPSF
jgi:hypothetical protein